MTVKLFYASLELNGEQGFFAFGGREKSWVLLLLIDTW